MICLSILRKLPNPLNYSYLQIPAYNFVRTDHLSSTKHRCVSVLNFHCYLKAIDVYSQQCIKLKLRLQQNL